MSRRSFPVDHPLLADSAAALDRYVALLEEDQALRHAEYDHPDPKRRRLKIACNECTTPWCCNQRVTVDLVEALAIYRWAATHAPAQLEAALGRGRDLHERPPATVRQALADGEDPGSAFFRRRVACPFLVKGRCAIFTVRPYRCRSHYMAGPPIKCRDELAPRDTFEMSPDRTLFAEAEAIAEEVRFAALALGAAPVELAETLYFIDRLLHRPPWRAPRVLDWDLVE